MTGPLRNTLNSGEISRVDLGVQIEDPVVYSPKSQVQQGRPLLEILLEAAEGRYARAKPRARSGRSISLGMRGRVGVAQICVAGLVCLLFALWAGAAGSTYYVNGASPACSDSGPGTATVPYCSISASLTARGAAGVTIFVQPGTYREQVTVPISGSPSAPLVLQSVG